MTEKDLLEKIKKDDQFFREIVFNDLRETKADIKKLNSKVNKINLTVATFASFFGMIGAYLQKKLGG